ncbi:MAG: isoprenylcysteine carboxylmethyltransferase family protein [bacterium]
MENSWYLKVLVKGFLAIIIILVLVFILAGRTNYWQGWVFGIVLILVFLVSAIIFKDKSDLARERLHPGPGTKWWDKIFWALYIPLSFSIFIIAPLDAGRFGWSGRLPSVTYVISYLIFFLSILIGQWAKYVNKWFSSTVRIQKDRGQSVVQEGPYRYVRHPGYSSAIPMYLTMPLVLGSFWGLIPACITAILLIIRTYLEDITLRKELPGYSAYTGKVRYRLLPWVW